MTLPAIGGGKIEKVIRIIESATDMVSGHVAGWLQIAMMLIMMAEVVSRYVLKQSLMVSDEFAAYMMVALSFLALAYAWRKHTHVRIEFVTDKLPLRAKSWLRLITLLIALVFIAALSKACYDLVAYSVVHGMRSSSWLRTPVAPVQIFMFIGSLMLFLQLIVEVIHALRALRTPDGQTL